MNPNPEQILAFRLEGHHLAERLPADPSTTAGDGALRMHPSTAVRMHPERSRRMLEAAGACGMQNTPPGAADLSLLARVDRHAPGDLEQALEIDKTLLQAWSLRGAPHIFPARDAAVFTRALLPGDEAAAQAFILGSQQALEMLGMTLTDAVQHTARAVETVLDGRILDNKRRLDQELAAYAAQNMQGEQLAVWGSPSIYGPNQTLGEAVISFCLRIVSLQGGICFAPRRGAEASFVRTDQWLGAALDQQDGSLARAELVRRFLACYGPSTRESLAAWAGISGNHAAEIWAAAEDNLVEVESGGYLHRLDRERFESPAEPRGVRFLPAHDPYLQMRDRELLLTDPAQRKQLWRWAGAPGAVLVEGRLAASWSARKKGKVLAVTITPFTALSGQTREDMEAEAAALAPFRGCRSVEVSFERKI